MSIRHVAAFRGLGICAIGAALSVSCGGADQTPPTPPVMDYFVYVANYYSHDVSAYSLDIATGGLTEVAGSPFYAGVNPRGVAVDANGRFVLVANTGSQDVWGYAVAAWGALIPVPGAPFTTARHPAAAAFHPSGRFAYVANGNEGTLSAFNVDAANGMLTPVPGSPFAAGNYGSGNGRNCFSNPTTVHVEPHGQFLYATSAGGSGCVAAFAIDAGTGGLTHMPGSPFVIFDNPAAAALDPEGRRLFLANSSGFRRPTGTLAAFALDTATGAPQSRLSEIQIGPMAFGIAVHPTGDFAYVASASEYPEFSGQIFVYAVGSTSGSLSPISGSPFPTRRRPEGLAIDPSGQFLLVTSYLERCVAVYRIDKARGALTEVPGSPFPAGDTPTGIAVLARPRDASASPPATPAQTPTPIPTPTPAPPNTGGNAFVYVANMAGGISGFRIDAATGALGKVAGSPFAAGRVPGPVLADPLGRFLYAHDFFLPERGGAGVFVYRVDGQTGAVTQAPGSPFAGFGASAVDPQGRFVYAIKGGVATYTVDSATGALAAAPSSPLAVTGGTVEWLVPEATGQYLYGSGIQDLRRPDQDGELPEEPDFIGRVWVYRVAQTSGALTAVAGSPFDVGHNRRPLIEPSGRFVYAVDGQSTTSVFALQSGGGLEALATASFSWPLGHGAMPSSIAETPSGRFLYFSGEQGILSYSIDATSGALTPLTDSASVVVYFADIALDRSGRFLYAVDDSDYGHVYGFAIAGQSGALSPLPGSPFAADHYPWSLTTLVTP